MYDKKGLFVLNSHVLRQVFLVFPRPEIREGLQNGVENVDDMLQHAQGRENC